MSDQPAAGAPEGADDLLEDLDLDASSHVDVSGGSTVYVARAPGESRPGIGGGFRGGGATGGAPTAKRASGAVLSKLAEEQSRGGARAPARGRIVRDTRWLVKKGADFKRAEVGIEGEPLWLEVTVDPALAPEGTPVAIEIFQQERSGGDEALKALEGQVGGDGKAVVEWRCGVLPGGDAKKLEPRLYFRATLGDDGARSTAVDVESFVEFTCRDDLDAPLECDYVVTLPHGREKKGRTDKQGAARFFCPPGEAKITLAPVKPG